jgi:hypothetical protein
VQIAHKTCKANDGRNEEYSVYLDGPELNIYENKISVHVISMGTVYLP